MRLSALQCRHDAIPGRIALRGSMRRSHIPDRPRLRATIAHLRSNKYESSCRDILRFLWRLSQQLCDLLVEKLLDLIHVFEIDSPFRTGMDLVELIGPLQQSVESLT